MTFTRTLRLVCPFSGPTKIPIPFTLRVLNKVVQNKILLITKSLERSPVGGRELLCKFNYETLLDIYQERLTLFEIAPSPTLGWGARMNALRGYIDGLNLRTIDAVLDSVGHNRIGKVFIDGSNLGALAKALKKQRPDIEITVFFHNVEARFFWGSLRTHKTIHALGVFVANWRAEYMAVHNSDKRVCLSKRDSRLLNRIYGREATHITPLSMADKFPGINSTTSASATNRFMLFVGGTFYANREGISWFVCNVVPRIDMLMCIVGRGFEDLREKLEISGKVKVVGTVEDLSAWYRNASFVVAPIFDGSGMKTKVAEALMHGKRVVGTPEAFSGYEDIAGQAGWVCSSVDEFVAAIEQAGTDGPVFDASLRQIYLDNYSFKAARRRFENIMQ